jgi:hypothetical protein
MAQSIENLSVIHDRLRNGGTKLAKRDVPRAVKEPITLKECLGARTGDSAFTRELWTVNVMVRKGVGGERGLAGVEKVPKRKVQKQHPEIAVIRLDRESTRDVNKSVVDNENRDTKKKSE